MVLGAFITQVPNGVFISVHTIALLLGVYFAVKNKSKNLFYLFLLYSLAELAYLLYHIMIFNMLFSHVIAEVLLLIAILVIGLKNED